MKTFAEQLRAAKDAKGFGADYELAEFLGIAPNHLSLYLRGTVMPRVDTVQEFANKLGVTFTFGE